MFLSSCEGSTTSCDWKNDMDAKTGCAHAQCERSGIVAPLASRAIGVVGKHGGEDGVLRTVGRQQDTGVCKYPQLILELTIIPPCGPGKEDNGNVNNPALPFKLAAVHDR